ncbi:hypothetical protein NG895_19830 [Aeoliella sp. ICT_H6.2]|uniref:Uncharacterized protein n=1 Tax=Aeoliella straminimaris TaxID=2954799 RepID=A0A9X2FIL8_9BACT|nr:hypothetical protein [Aeoliella straminimaris]MCO6046156.1 hypothetical protein [Aeoliella straminimaris]
MSTSTDNFNSSFYSVSAALIRGGVPEEFRKWLLEPDERLLPVPPEIEQMLFSEVQVLARIENKYVQPEASTCPLGRCHELTHRVLASTDVYLHRYDVTLTPVVATKDDYRPLIVNESLADRLMRLQLKGLSLCPVNVHREGVKRSDLAAIDTPRLYMMRTEYRARYVKGVISPDFSNTCPHCGASPFICPACCEFTKRCFNCHHLWRELDGTDVFPEHLNKSRGFLIASSVPPDVHFFDFGTVSRTGIDIFIDCGAAPLAVTPRPSVE